MAKLAATRGPDSDSTMAAQSEWAPPALLIELMDGDVGLIAELISTFSEDAAKRALIICNALAGSDFAVIAAEAHTIKGGARQVGADAVAEECQALETVSRSRDRALVAEQLNRTLEALAGAEQAMADYRDRRRPDAVSIVEWQ